MRKCCAVLLLLFFPLLSYAFHSDPPKPAACPSATAMAQVKFDLIEAQVFGDLKTLIFYKKKSQFDTNDQWSLLALVQSKKSMPDQAESLNLVINKLQSMANIEPSLAFNKHGLVWTCSDLSIDESTGNYISIGAFTPPSDDLPF